MKILVVGGGSIGTRHLENLKILHAGPLAFVEPDSSRRSEIAECNAVRAFPSLSAGLAWQPDIALITSPTHLHIAHATLAAQQGCHLFIEKPLCALSSDEYMALLDTIEQHSLITLVGCNMRFHPGPAQVKALVEADAIGKVLFARLHTGSYLPEWRPWQDYRKSYSANASMGGGCLLDCIHEIDLMRWFLGPVSNVFCLARNTGTLDVDVEDVAALICRHRNGAHSELHLDYVQRSYERGCQIVGEYGSIFWDFNTKAVRWFDSRYDEWHLFEEPSEWEMNHMYLDEMRHFLNCVAERKPSVLPVAEALNVMRVVFAAKESAEKGCMVGVQKEQLP